MSISRESKVLLRRISVVQILQRLHRIAHRCVGHFQHISQLPASLENISGPRVAYHRAQRSCVIIILKPTAINRNVEQTSADLPIPFLCQQIFYISLYLSYKMYKLFIYIYILHTLLRSILLHVLHYQLVGSLEIGLVPLVRSDPTLRNEVSPFLKRRM